MNFEELVDIVKKLRGPDGCPWDREQTRESLRPYLVEEFYELIDALEENDYQGMEEESGDLLFQILLQSRLSEEEGKFDINDVVEGIARKMIKRHPHVFGDKDLRTSEDVSKWWREYKKKEGKNYGSAIDGTPQSLPALIRAQQIQFKAAKAGFDRGRIEDVFEKLEQETRELKDAVNRKEHEKIEDELGDLFFVLVRIAGSVKVNPEDALRKTIKKFIQRFRRVETEASKQDKNLTDMTPAEMDVLWNEAKRE